MLTTPELRGQFEKSFRKIMKKLSPELQQKWDGVIAWKDEHSYPDIESAIIKELPVADKAAYVSLLNKLSRGRI